MKKFQISLFILLLITSVSYGQNLLPKVLIRDSDSVKLINPYKRSNATYKIDKASYLKQLKTTKASPSIFYKPHLLTDTAKANNYVLGVHAGASPLYQPYSGKGVVVGIIDTGLYTDHPDYRDSNDNTRVRFFWDQENDGVGVDENYNYGSFYDSSDINNGLFADEDTQGHGTSVGGVMMGNGSVEPSFKGIAYDAEIVVVKTDFSRANWLGTVADAVEYIFRKADELNLPCVVNISAGSYLGSHDAKDQAALRIDSMLNAKPGRMVVCAAGNSGDKGKYHVKSKVQNDSVFTWFKVNNDIGGLGYPGVFIEAWGDVQQMNDLEFKIIIDTKEAPFRRVEESRYVSITEIINAGSNLNDTILNNLSDTFAIVQYFAQEDNGRYVFQAFIENPDSTEYYYGLQARGTGEYDVWNTAWLGLNDIVETVPNQSQFPLIVNYKLPDSLSTIVSSFACSDKVLTTANVNKDVGYIDYNGEFFQSDWDAGKMNHGTSKGPSRLGVQKPNISATGNRTMTCASPSFVNRVLGWNSPERVHVSGEYALQGGTSMASPVVAGVVALMLEQCPNMRSEDIFNSITSGAFEDSYTGVVPNYIAGNGKLNAFNSLTISNYTPKLLYGTSTFCSNDSVFTEVDNEAMDIVWMDESIKERGFFVNQAKDVFYSAINDAGCVGYSDTISFTTINSPNNPIIYQQNDTLFTSQSDFYRWYSNGNLIPNSNNWFLKLEGEGSFFVEVFNSSGCNAFSDTLEIYPLAVNQNFTGVLKLYPNPIIDNLILESSFQSNTKLLIKDVLGKVVAEFFVSPGKNILNLFFLKKGVYIIDVPEFGVQTKILKE